MACNNLTISTLKGCNDSQGGIKKIFMAPTISGSGYAFTFTPAISVDNTDTGIITSITSGSNKFYQFVPNKYSSNWSETVTTDVKNGSVVNVQNVVGVFSKNEAAKRNQIKLLAQNEFYVIVQDANDKYWLLGEQNGCDLATGAMNSGTALADLNGWTVTLVGNERYPAREVSGSLIAGLTSAV